MERIKINIQRFASNNVDIELTAKTDKLQSQMRSLISTIGSLKASLQASNIEYGANSKNTEVLTQRNEILNKTLDAQQKLVKNLKSQSKLLNTENAESAKQKEKLAGKISKVNDEMIKNEARMNKNSRLLQQQTQETYTYKDAVKELGDAFSGLNFASVINMAKRFATGLYTNFITKSIDTTEELNLFNVVFNNISENGTKTFSELGKQATEFQHKLNDAFGTNMKDTMRYQGLFQAMGESAGLSDDVAMLMSENMTKLAYDLASLYNTTETKAAESLRAGVYAGQTKPLRNYGIDVTQTSYKPLMQELGLEKSVSELTQAEKEILRYIATLKQAQNAMGDFANTIESPANQLKILRQQFYEMQVAIGNLFTGAFARLLPYANAIVMTIKWVAQAIAGFFGIEMSDYNSGLAYYEEDLYDYGEALDSVGSSAGGASKAIDKLKRQTLAFDQINNLTTPTDTSGSGGGGGSGGGLIGGIDNRLLEALKGYDNGMDKVRMKAKDIAEKMMKILGFTRDINGEWEWGGFSKLVKNFTSWFADLDFKEKTVAVVGMLTAFTLLFNVLKGFGKLTGVTSLFKTIGSVGGKLFGAGGTAAAGTAAAGEAAGGGAAAAGGGAAAAGGMSAGAWAAAIAAIVAEVAALTAGFNHFENKVRDFLNSDEWNWSWEDSNWAAFIAAMNIAPGSGSFSVTALTISTIWNAFKDGIEPLTSDDILDLADASDKTKEVLGQVLGDYDQFGKNLNEIYALHRSIDENGLISFIVTDANIKELERLFNDATQITVTSLEEQKQAALTSLDSMKDKLGDKYEGMRQSIIDSYDKQIEDANNSYARITEILEGAKARDGKLTQEEMNELNEIRNKAGGLAIDQLSDNMAEAYAIRQTMKEKAKNLAAEEASALLKKSAEVRDKTIEDAKKQHDEVLIQAEKLKAAGAIDEEGYKMMRKAADETYDQTVKDAKQQHEDIYNEFASQNEEIAKYINSDTGEVYSSWTMFWTKVKDKHMELAWGIATWFEEKFNPKMKEEGGKAVDNIQEGIDNKCPPTAPIKVEPDPKWEIQQKLNNNTNGVSATVPVDVNMPTKTSLSSRLGNLLSGLSGSLNILFSKKADGGIFVNGGWQNIQGYANGGVPSGGQLFMAREAGPELVGRIGRHTAVMNNNQIVDSVRAGVYDAVSAAMGNANMGAIELVAHTDEGVIIDRINRITRQTGECPIDI